MNSRAWDEPITLRNLVWPVRAPDPNSTVAHLWAHQVCTTASPELLKRVERRTAGWSSERRSALGYAVQAIVEAEAFRARSKHARRKEHDLVARDALSAARLAHSLIVGFPDAESNLPVRLLVRQLRAFISAAVAVTSDEGYEVRLASKAYKDFRSQVSNREFGATLVARLVDVSLDGTSASAFDESAIRRRYAGLKRRRLPPSAPVWKRNWGTMKALAKLLSKSDSQDELTSTELAAFEAALIARLRTAEGPQPHAFRQQIRALHTAKEARDVRAKITARLRQHSQFGSVSYRAEINVVIEEMRRRFPALNQAALLSQLQSIHSPSAAAAKIVVACYDLPVRVVREGRVPRPGPRNRIKRRVGLDVAVAEHIREGHRRGQPRRR